MKVLYDEHEMIVNAIDVSKQAGSLIGKDNELYENIVGSLLLFFKIYADEYHHHKEEEILFPEMVKRNEMLENGIIKEMFENHADFRVMIQNIRNNLASKNYSRVQEILESYTENLLDHIAVENDEVFHIAESIFTEKELNDISFRFQDSDRELGADRKKEMTELIDSLRKKLMLAE